MLVPMNLAGMGSSGIDNVTQQMAASQGEASGSGQNQYNQNQNQNLAGTAGLISNIANM